MDFPSLLGIINQLSERFYYFDMILVQVFIIKKKTPSSLLFKHDLIASFNFDGHTKKILFFLI